MSKALIIKGTNFSENKIETVSFSGNVPCTGIAVTPSTITFTSIGSTQTLSIVKTPANTTDDVEITSSDESVCTVSGSVVTATGMGSATITVTCGEESSTCVVIIESIEFSPAWSTGELKDFNNTHMYIVGNEASRYIFAAKSIEEGETSEIFYLYHDVEAMDIPIGCEKIRVTMDNFIGNNIRVAWYDSTSKPYTNFPECIEGIQLDNNVTILQAGNEFTVPSGADKFVVGVETNDMQTQYADMSSVAASANIEITAVIE